MKTVLERNAPKYLTNYGPGWVGFTYHPDQWLSYGIAYFERYEDADGIPVTHTFVCSGPDKCIEALGRGIVESDLGKYFNDPKCRIFFLRPKGWSEVMGMRIVSAAHQHIGDRYGYGIIAADALGNTLAGRAINRLTGGLLSQWLWKRLDRPKAEICSELVADALQAQPEFNGVGCLKGKSWEITPQMLFEDDFVFEQGTQ